MRYVILGKPFARVRVNGRRMRVEKKAHTERDGRTLCQIENAYRRDPPRRYVEEPGEPCLCRNCIGLLARLEPSSGGQQVIDDATLERALRRWATEAA